MLSEPVIFNSGMKQICFFVDCQMKTALTARQSAQTEFPLSETICWSESSPLTGSSRIPSEFTVGQSVATAQRQRRPGMGLNFNMKSRSESKSLHLKERDQTPGV